MLGAESNERKLRWNLPLQNTIGVTAEKAIPDIHTPRLYSYPG